MGVGGEQKQTRGYTNRCTTGRAKPPAWRGRWTRVGADLDTLRGVDFGRRGGNAAEAVLQGSELHLGTIFRPQIEFEAMCLQTGKQIRRPWPRQLRQDKDLKWNRGEDLKDVTDILLIS